MGWGGKARRVFQLQGEKLGLGRERGEPKPVAQRGLPLGQASAQRRTQGPAGVRIPTPAGSHSHGQLAGDGQGVAPLQGPILPPLGARNGPGWLLCGDAVPGGVGRTRLPGPPALPMTLPREDRLGLEACCPLCLFRLPSPLVRARLSPQRARHLPCTPQSTLLSSKVQLTCQPPPKAGSFPFP